VVRLDNAAVKARGAMFDAFARREPPKLTLDAYLKSKASEHAV
jgi:hypothetical protein